MPETPRVDLTTRVQPHAISPGLAIAISCVILAFELAALGIVFKHLLAFRCLDNWPPIACRTASGALVSVYCVIGGLALYGTLRKATVRQLVQDAGTRIWPLALNVLGFALAFLPATLLKEGVGTEPMATAFALWTAGTLLLFCGIALFVAPAQRWRELIANNGCAILFVVVSSAAAAPLATLIRPVWRLDNVADATFGAVSWLIKVFGYDIETFPSEKVIGAGDFFISIAPVCSGVEGMALVTAFTSIYLFLFRRGMRFPRAFWLYPIGILVSALFNVVRITILLVIGIEGNPGLAVGAFHSHAGWLMFTFVAFGIIALAQTLPFLQRESPVPDMAAGTPAGLQPFWQDPVMAAIAPFVVFMLTSIPATALLSAPGSIYPLRVLIVGAVMLGFVGVYRALPWRFDLSASIAGAAVGLVWIAIPIEANEPATLPYGELGGALLLGWFVCRGLGTTVLVPIVEELFFRGYLHDRLRIGAGRPREIFAALLTACLFAALHDRWAEAFAAGLVFSWCARRNKGRITDAILAHAVANMIVFATAVLTGNLAVI